MALSAEDRRAFERGSHQTTQRKFSGKTWTRYVEYLRDGVPPPGPTARALKAKIEKGYYWDKDRGLLIYKAGNLITVHEDQIFDIIAYEYQKLQFRGCYSLWRAVRDKYHGILQEDTKRFIALCKSRERAAAADGGAAFTQDDRQDNRPLTRFGDIAGSAEHGCRCEEQDDEVDADADLPEMCYDDVAGYELQEENQHAQDLLEEAQRWIYWLEDMNDHEWPPSQENCRYKDMINGLYTILRTAEPANTYVPDRWAQADVCSTSYEIADLLRLTMEQATDELENSEGPSRPILINADDVTTGNLGSVEGCLREMRQFIDYVTVQDLGRQRGETPMMKWPTEQVLERFSPWSKLPEEEPPIDFDVGIVGMNGIPDCFSTENMIYLKKFGSAISGHPVGSRNSLFHRSEKWRQLSQGGSITMPRQDHCGFWTWVKVEEGAKLWLICQLNGDDDRARFASEGPEFVGGRWFYFWLEPGQVVVMPPGTVYATFTPMDTLCIGGNAWSQRHMGDSMRSIAFEAARPHATNDDTARQLSEILDKVAGHMEGACARDPDMLGNYGDRGQVEVFRRHYKEYLQTRKRFKRPRGNTLGHIIPALRIRLGSVLSGDESPKRRWSSPRARDWSADADDDSMPDDPDYTGDSSDDTSDG
ncbi:hypothetical protein GP486_008214 [Trichoglossum hirsutum]|uniref:JmjC domain-containing protein n=1 Tax=Trichoglossum hirsutum TaxID=265104 RepID=A0A9P8L6D8_9PEZI|nr:hypothetical protein GP486_008214 [Trichoglossum hirsutum]